MHEAGVGTDDGRGLLASRTVAACDDHRRALLRQQSRGLQPDARRPAGDQCGVVDQFHAEVPGHRASLVTCESSQSAKRCRIDGGAGDGTMLWSSMTSPKYGACESATTCAGVAVRGEARADEVVHADLVGARDLGDGVGRRLRDGAGDGGGDVFGRHRLHQRVRQPHDVAVRRRVGDLRDELVELGGPHDRVRRRPTA